MTAKELRQQFGEETGMVAHQSPWAYAKWIEDYHQAKSKEEAEERYEMAIELRNEYGYDFLKTLAIASGKEEG